MRKLLWIIAIPIILIVGAMLILPMVLDAKSLVKIAAEQIEAQSGIRLEVDGDASFSLFPKVSLSTSDVRVEVPDSQMRVEAGTLSAGVALFPILTGTVDVESVQVQDLTLTTVAEDEEAARAATLDTSTLSDRELDAFYAARDRARDLAGAEAAASVIAAPLALEVGELALSNIRVITVDDSGEPLSELQLRYLTATGMNIDGRPVPLEGEVLIPGSDGSADMEVKLAGEFTTDLDAQAVTLNKLDVTVTGATAEPLTLTAQGKVALDTQVADLTLSLESGTLEGNGDVRYASFESPQIDATMALTELNPALLFLAGPEAAEALPEDSSSDADTPLPLHALRMVDTRAVLTIDKVVVDPHTLEDVTATLRVVDGVATLEPVQAMVHGGAINFKAVLNGRYNNAKLATEGGVTDIDVNRAVAALDAGVGARGAANLTWKLTGEGASSATLTESLTGPISFTTNDITVENIGLEQMVCRGVALVNQEALSAEFPTDTQFQALEAQIQLADGKARLNPLTAQLPAIGLGGGGNLDIASGDLRFSFRAQLNAGLGELDPACRINERYADLRWPVECKGNLADDPASWCGVNTTEIIKDLAEGEVKRQVTNEASKLLKKLFE